MKTATPTPSLMTRRLRGAAPLAGGSVMTDGDLLESYVRRRDEASFGALLRRHGPMVWGVCRRVLGNEADAEDAFQATFLVLVRKAESVVPPSRVGNFLHGVAHNTALKARAMNRQRQVKEQTAGSRRPEPPTDAQQHLHALLDQELRLLPEKYRVPVVLCELEGRTIKDAAVHLGCPQGTVAGRLARARTLLAKRLTRHGLVLSAGALALAIAESRASATVPGLLTTSTIWAATGGAIPARVAMLTEGVMKAMFLTKLKMVVALAGAMLVLAGALGVVTVSGVFQTQSEARGDRPRPTAREADPPTPGLVWKERTLIDPRPNKGHQVFSASLSPDGKQVVCGMSAGCVLLDAATGKEVASLAGDVVMATAVSPDGKTIATGHLNAIKVWDAATGKEIATLANDTRNIAKVAFSPDGKLLATAEAGALRLWDLAAKKELRRFEAGKADERVVYSATFSPDGKTLASAEGRAKTVKLWDVATGKELKTLEGHEKAVIDVAFSPDGKTLASAGGDEQVKLWDVGTLKERTALKWQTSGRNALAFSPDSKLLVTAGGESNNAMVWDAQTGKDIVILDHTDQVWSAAFSGDGKTLVTAGDDGVRLWQQEKK